MGYRNLTCHHLGSAHISLSLGQCRDSCIALFWSCLVTLQAVFRQMIRLAIIITVLTVLGQMANSFVVMACRCIITITQMLSFARVAKWPLLKVPLSLFTSPELSWPALVSWPTFPLTSCLRLSTRPTKHVLILRLPHLKPKPSTTMLISHCLKWMWS